MKKVVYMPCRKNVQLDLTESELFVIIGGGLFLSGYNKYHNKRMYLSKESPGPTKLSDSIRCNRDNSDKSDDEHEGN